MMSARLFIRAPLLLMLLLMLMGLSVALPGRASFQELRKLLRQQQQDEQQLKEQQFNEDLNSWLQALEQLGQDLAAFVNQCRPRGSRCGQRQVQRRLRSLRRSHSDLRAQLETLEISYVGKISEEELLMPALRAVRQVLHQYEDFMRLINTEAYKLIHAIEKLPAERYT
ncbi:uncharacterized protein LOC6578012 [Drosophila mojavensis]|uniref:Uncharacterized protein, isoform B n=1 Tax=Drosophila mojavensis TaxID=7230 RepID=A0A0Q9X678_DROMO|nr:uncharacterized protein LOC6578012 [Drosophila mojavensis]KRG03723.1 uncharacterized protein Dmoj_GI20335, isoform B [Drosophila mojavensis]